MRIGPSESLYVVRVDSPTLNHSKIRSVSTLVYGTEKHNTMNTMVLDMLTYPI